MMIHRRSDGQMICISEKALCDMSMHAAHNRALSHHTAASLSGVRISATERWCGRESAREFESNCVALLGNRNDDLLTCNDSAGIQTVDLLDRVDGRARVLVGSSFFSDGPQSLTSLNRDGLHRWTRGCGV